MIQAKSGEVSSDNHIYNLQDLDNQNDKFNPNLNEENILLTYNSDKNNYSLQKFKRDNNNQEMRDKQKAFAENLDKQARADYKLHKLEEKAKNPQKKIRTDLQSKNLKKEFVIGFGNTTREEVMKMGKKEIAQKCLNGALAILKAKQLEPKNLIGIAVHFDEKGLPHAHVQYNCYSFKEKTTDTQLEKCLNKDKKKQFKDRTQKFSDYQSTLAEAMGLERGLKGSKRANLTVNEIRAKKAQEEAEKATKMAELAKNQLSQSMQEMENLKKQLQNLKNECKEIEKDRQEKQEKLNGTIKRMSIADRIIYNKEKEKTKNDIEIK